MGYEDSIQRIIKVVDEEIKKLEEQYKGETKAQVCVCETFYLIREEIINTKEAIKIAFKIYDTFNTPEWEEFCNNALDTIEKTPEK